MYEFHMTGNKLFAENLVFSLGNESVLSRNNALKLLHCLVQFKYIFDIGLIIRMEKYIFECDDTLHYSIKNHTRPILA